MKIIAPTILTLCLAQAHAQDLEHSETAILAAEVHVANYNNTKNIFLTIANDYHNTVSCSGKVMVITDVRGNIGTDTLSFNNLRIYPRNAFPYQIAYPISNNQTKNYVDTSYDPIQIKCKGWDFLITLPSAICLLDPEAHAKNCKDRGHVYPFMIANYWLGSCSC